MGDLERRTCKRSHFVEHKLAISLLLQRMLQHLNKFHVHISASHPFGRSSKDHITIIIIRFEHEGLADRGETACRGCVLHNCGKMLLGYSTSNAGKPSKL
jgi:hypothetical protein